jgi:hypothetical protein
MISGIMPDAPVGTSVNETIDLPRGFSAVDSRNDRC